MPDISIGRLTVRSDTRSVAALGAPALRLRAERALAAAGLHPPGMPPSAILVIRRLASPQRHDVEAHYRAAVRPATGAATGNAPAVLFADAAELLACLTRDALSGEIARRWYWRQFAPPAAPSAPAVALARAFTAHAAALPRAWAQLGRTEAVRATALLDPAQVMAVTRSLQAAYALPPPPPAPTAAEPTPPPWRPWLPASDAASLAPAAERLLGTGLALAHAPAHARSAAFAGQSAAWLAGARDARQAPLSRPTPQIARRGNQASSPSDPPALRFSHIAAAGLVAAAPAEPDAPPFVGSSVAVSRVDAPPIAQRSLAPAPPPAPAPPVAPPAVAPAAPRPEAARSDAAPLPLAEPIRPWLAGGAATELAGAFFLLNLLSYLDLPHGWPARRHDAALSAWALMEALARGLLGRDCDRYAADPLWDALAALDGRPAGAPLRAGLDAGDTGLPAAWLRKANAGTFEGGRATRLPRAVAQAMDRPTAAWLRRVLPFTRGLLGRAMGVEAARAGAELIVRPGRLAVTNTHVDVSMAMSAISLPARRAGLDADPGWVPDLARIVQFHYG